MLAALANGSLWTCNVDTGADVQDLPVSQHALVETAPFPAGDSVVVRDYLGGVALVPLRPVDQSLASRPLNARGRIRALHWHPDAERVAGVDESGQRFAIERQREDWAARPLPAAPQPTGQCRFLPDGRLISIESELSNNLLHVHEWDGGRSRKVWPRLLGLEEFRTLSAIGVSPGGTHGAFAIARPGVGGATVCLFETTPWREVDRFEFPDREVYRIAPADGLRRVLFGFKKLAEPPLLWSRDGIERLPIDGSSKPKGLEAGEQHSVSDLAIAADGSRYLIVDRHGDLWQFDHRWEGPAEHRKIGTGKLACDLSPDGRLAAVLSGERYLEVLQLSRAGGARQLCELVAPWNVEVFCLTDDCSMLLVGGRGAVCAYSFQV
jgi:hypothetical protein